MVKAFRSKMFLCVYVASRKETATHGGAVQQIPPAAAVITFGFPFESYVPTTNTGKGYIMG